MNRRTFLQVAGTGSIIGLSGCSAVGADDEDGGRHRHLRSSSVWNGVPETIDQTVFVPDVVVRDDRVDVLATVSLDLPAESDYRPTELSFSLAVDTIADEWTGEWRDRHQLSRSLSARIESGGPVSITSRTTFESGGSIQTTRYEEVR